MNKKLLLIFLVGCLLLSVLFFILDYNILINKIIYIFVVLSFLILIYFILKIFWKNEENKLKIDFDKHRSEYKKTIERIKSKIESINMNTEVLEKAFENSIYSLIGLSKSVKKIDEGVLEQKNSVASTSSAVEEMVHSIDTIANNIQSLSSSTSQSSAAVEELVASINNIAETTKRADNFAKELLMTVEKSGKDINDNIVKISKIKEDSEKIIDIIKIIDNIASQTNLLAMNAAIEAAHAGQYGKGFAVVADEIRKLADISSVNSKEISNTIKSITEKINDTIVTSQNTLNSIKEIIKNVDQTTKIINNIYSSTQEQSAGTKEILSAIASLMNITEEVTSSLQEQKNANSEIMKVAEQLRNINEVVVNAVLVIIDKYNRINDMVNIIGKISIRNTGIVLDIKNLIKEVR